MKAKNRWDLFDGYCLALSLDPTTREMAERNFAHLTRSGTTQRRAGDPEYRYRIAASIYTAIKRNPLCPPTQLRQFCDAFAIARLPQELGEAPVIFRPKAREMLKYLWVLEKRQEEPIQACYLRPDMYIELGLRKLKADEILTAKTMEVLERVRTEHRTAGRPSILAGAIISYASNHCETHTFCTDTQIARAVGLEGWLYDRKFSQTWAGKMLREMYRPHQGGTTHG